MHVFTHCLTLLPHANIQTGVTMPLCLCAAGGRLVANSTRVMPGETFGCPALFFSPGARLEEVYTMHMFRGVWRKTFNEAVKVQLQNKQQAG